MEIAVRFHVGALIIATATLLILTTTTESLRFELKSGHTKCITEDIKSNSLTVGKYHLVNPHGDDHPLPDSHRVTVSVTSSYGNNYHSADNVATGQFAFTAAEAGDYMTCFWAMDHKPEETLTVEFEWRSGIAAKDWTNVAKKGSVEAMELELKKLQDTITSIQEEMYYLREREAEMQDLNNATYSRMATFGYLSLFLCLLVAGLQYWHLKNYFQKKKLI